jgi:hypothetical protein
MLYGKAEIQIQRDHDNNWAPLLTSINLYNTSSATNPRTPDSHEIQQYKSNICIPNLHTKATLAKV